MQTRRDFLKKTGVGAALLSAARASDALAAGRKPNLVWLVSEDNSKHFMKLFDENGAETPNIEKLADQGVIFTHAFSNCPVCSAARSSLATCCYGSRIGTHFHRKHVSVPLPKGVHNFAAILRGAGYYTSNKKKTDYNFKDTLRPWDSSSDWRGRKPGQPFFHMQSFGTTHEGSLHARVSTGPTPDGKAVFVPPIHPSTPIFQNTYARYHGRIRALDREIGRVVDALQKDGLLEDTFIFYFGDHGGVLPGSKGYIYETGLHVPLVIRIPDKYKAMVDLKRGSKAEGFVSFIDFGPTLLHLAGIKVPEGMDGRAFMGPGITLADLDARDETFGMADRFDEKYDLVRTLRKGRFKYMRSYQPFTFDGLQNNYRYKMMAYQEWRKLHREGKLDKAQSAFFEPRAAEALYDVEADPYETRNLAPDPAHAGTLRDMRERLARKVKGLPDLSLFPESFLAADAFRNPVAFGRAHKEEIAQLVDIADLSLVAFPKARSGIEAALSSENRWKRYWGLIACSSHGKAASGFVEKAKRVAAGDPDLLVRTRAAEFLGLIGADDPRPVLMDVLRKSADAIETLLVLNTVVLLQDGKPGYKFSISRADVKSTNSNVSRRLQYLGAAPAQKGRKRKRKKSN